ncbi:MAG: protein phosphatase 2C domain-containing protein [Agriterribacter sp.]
MKIYSVLQIGEYHINHCEDYLFVGEIGNGKTLCAVMDGCTTAIDSHLISTLVGKLLRKIVKEKGYKDLYNPEAIDNLDSYLKSILKDLFKELNIIKGQLMLERNELLTTLILLLVDKSKNEGIILAIGDGLVSINGEITEFEQDNKPDYLGFHLAEDFENWYSIQTQKIIFHNIHDIGIATDGIYMFKPFKKTETTDYINPIEFLLSDKTNSENEDMLNLKLKKLEHNFGLKPTDDIAIIRLIKD